MSRVTLNTSIVGRRHHVDGIAPSLEESGVEVERQADKDMRRRGDGGLGGR